MDRSWPAGSGHGRVGVGSVVVSDRPEGSAGIRRRAWLRRVRVGTLKPEPLPAVPASSPRGQNGRVGHDGRAATSRWSLWSEDSLLCIASKGSVLSIGSIGSFLSVGSVGSFASWLSIGSFASGGSAMSAQSRWSIMSWRSSSAVQDSTQTRRRFATMGPPGVVAMAAALAWVGMQLERRRRRTAR